jgi:hypothetical protein
MELVALIRVLWRRKILGAAGLVASIALGAMYGKAPPASSAVAWTRLVLDTPKSQLIDSAPGYADSLPWRGQLLVHLMATEDVRKRLAQAVGVPPHQIAVIDPELSLPRVPASLPAAAAKVAGITYAPYVLTMFMADDSLPMISFEAAAPDARGARKLAEAAIAVMKSKSSAGGTYTSPIMTAGVQVVQSFDVEDVAPVHDKTIVVDKGYTMAIVLTIFAFLAWCGCIAFAPLVLRILHPPAPLPG